MADVDLDVHGVRYAQIHIDLKHDMKLQGLGFIALLDFTTVDTLKASLERVISDRTGRDDVKVEAVCYYKKRRRGAVPIKTQRDVMLACCEYPLVTRTGKPAPDTYIRVGVFMKGLGGTEVRNALTSALLPRVTICGGNRATTLGGVVRPTKKYTINWKKPPPAPSERGNAESVHTRRGPPPKRVCVTERMEWQLLPCPPSPPMVAMEIKPIESPSVATTTADDDDDDDDEEEERDERPRSSPDITIPAPPSLPVQIKEEPLDYDSPTPLSPLYNGSAGSGIVVGGGGGGFGSPALGSSSVGKGSGRSASTEESTDDMATADDDDGGGGSGRGGGMIGYRVTTQQDGSTLLVALEEVKKMESRLNSLEEEEQEEQSDSRNGRLTPPPPDLGSPDGADDVAPGGLASRLGHLERRISELEQRRRRQPPPRRAGRGGCRSRGEGGIHQRLSSMERTLSRTLSAVDKLSKSLAQVSRKHGNTSRAVEQLCSHVKSIQESQELNRETLEKIKNQVQKDTPSCSSSSCPP